MKHIYKLSVTIIIIVLLASCTSTRRVPSFYMNNSTKYHKANYGGKTIRKTRIGDSLPIGYRSYQVDSKRKK